MTTYRSARRICLAIAAALAFAACVSPQGGDDGQTSQDLTGTATVSTDMPSYTAGQTVTVSYMNLPGNKYDWISVAVAGSPDTSYVRFYFTNGQINGTQAFTNLAPGSYEARAYQNDTYTLLARSSFTVAPAPTVTTDKSTYQPGQTVTVSYSNLPGNPKDWVAVAVAGSPDTSVVQRFYTNGQVNGSQAFTGLAVGNYEARTYVNDTFTVLARSSFSVSNVTVSTDASAYSVGQTVTVSYSGMPGSSTDWISVAPAGSPDTSYTAWHFTGGATSGTMQFTGLAAGTYEARAYPRDTYNLLARSSAFTVGGATCTMPAQAPVLGSVASGDLVIDASSQQATASLTVPLANSILFTSLNENEPSPQYGGVICDLHDVDMVQMLPAGITCRRANLGTDMGSGVINIHWTVATFTSGVTVQRGDANTSPTTPLTVTLGTAVDPSQSFVLLDGILTGGTGWGNNEFVRAQLVDGQTLDLRTAVAGSKVSWQVVSMLGASVQRGTTSFGTSDLEKTVAISTLPSGSMVLASYTSDNVSGIAAAALMMQTSLASASKIDFKRNQGGSNLDVSWQAISLPYATHMGTASFAIGETSQTVNVAGIDPTTSVALASSQSILGQSGGSTTYNGSLLDLVGEGTASLSTGSGMVTIQRATSQASATIPWTVIDFAHNCAGM